MAQAGIKKSVLLFFVVFLMVAFLAGCASDAVDEGTGVPTDETPEGDSDIVLIGCLIPFTGVETHNGLSMQYGAQIAAEMVNESGGINGKSIEFVFEDTTGAADVAVEKAKRMVEEDGVEIIIGTLSSAETYAVFDYTQSVGVIFMNPTFYPAELNGKYYFATGATPSQVIYPLIDYATELGYDNYYFIGSDYVWGTASAAAGIRYAESLGKTVIGKEFVPFGGTDYSSNIARIVQSGADILFPFVAGSDGATFLQQFYDFGASADFLIVGDYLDELLIPALSPGAAEGLVNTSGYYTFIDTPENKAFLERLYELDGAAQMGNFGANMYHNVLLYAEAANKAGTIEADAVSAAMEGISINGLAGPMTIDPESHHTIQNIIMAKVLPDKTFEVIKVFEQIMPAVEVGLVY